MAERISTVTMGAMQLAEKTVLPEGKKQGFKLGWKRVTPKLVSPKEAQKMYKKIRLVKLKQFKKDFPEMEKIKKEYPNFNDDIIEILLKRNISITLKNADKLWAKEKRSIRKKEFRRVLERSATVAVPGFGLETAADILQKGLKREPPKTKTGKKLAWWGGFAFTMMNPASVYRLLPGGAIIKGASRLKAFRIVDYALRKTVPKKLLSHAYRIIQNSIKGGINIPVLTLADGIIRTTQDSKYAKKVLPAVKKSVLPGLLIGGVLPELGRGIKKVGTKLFKNDYHYRQLYPVEWSMGKLKINDPNNMNLAKKNYDTRVRNYRNVVQTDKVVDNMREYDDAYKFLGRINKTRIKPIPSKEIRLTEKAVAEQYLRVKDASIGAEDVRLLENNIRTLRNQKELLGILGKKKLDIGVRRYDEAMTRYIDIKNDPKAINRNWNKLNNEQQGSTILSQNLPRKVKQLAEKIEKQNQLIGRLGVEADIIKNTKDNYVNRIWDPESFGKEKGIMEQQRAFGTKTRHRFKRKFTTILDGEAKGGKLQTPGMTENSKILYQEFIKTIEDKKFLNMMRGLSTVEGLPLVSTFNYSGYRKINHPNMTVWKKIDQITRAGKAKVKAAKLYGSQDVFKKTEIKTTTTPRGFPFRPVKLKKPKRVTTYFERQDLYAPKKYARNLNDIFGTSSLMKFVPFAKITKYNAWLKASTLQSGHFHHWALGRSYWLPTDKRWGEYNPLKMYKAGIKEIEGAQPMLKELVRHGLTLGLKQEWSEELLTEKTLIGKWLDKNKVSKKVKDKILDLRKKHVDWLFGEYGAGLKSKASLITLRELQKKYPNSPPETLYRMTANLINDDFGGLHLKRIGGVKIAGIKMGGRNPTIQHVFRLACLAPDWTESNLRTMVKAIKGGYERDMYQKFWGRIFLRGMVLSTVANITFHGGDTIDAYKRMIQEYGLPGMFLTDITPIYEALGGKTGNRKYFAFLGHFLDPLKFVLRTGRTARYKASKVAGIGIEFATGRDWAERVFTTLPELLGFDYEKGVYRTTRTGLFKKGEPKWGKLRGRTVTWKFRGGALRKTQYPSFLINQTYRSLPIPAQNLIAYFLGDQDAFNAILDTLGMQIKTTFGGKETAMEKGFTMVGDKDIIDIFQMERIKPGVAPKVEKKKKIKLIPKVEKKKKIYPYQKYLDMGYTPYLAKQLYEMTPEQRLIKLRELKEAKLRKGSIEKFEKGLYRQKELNEEQIKRFTDLTNRYKLREKDLSEHIRRELIKKKGDAYLNYLEKHLKKGEK